MMELSENYVSIIEDGEDRRHSEQISQHRGQPARGGSEPRHDEPQQRGHHLPRSPALLRDRSRQRRDGEDCDRTAHPAQGHTADQGGNQRRDD